MAVYREDIVDIDLDGSVIKRSFLNRTIGLGDNMANRFGIRVRRGGATVDLTGVTCQGYFMAPDGSNIAITNGVVNGDTAYITLPQACYNYEGQFCLSIKLIGGGVTGTMRIVDGTVNNTGVTGAVAPTGTVPTYQEILAVYGEMVEDLEDIEEYKTVLKNDGTLDLFPFLNTVTAEVEYNGIKATPNEDGSITLDGTASALWNLVFFYTDVDNDYIKQGDKILFKYETEDSNAPLQIWYVPSGGELTFAFSMTANSEVMYTIPSNCTKLYARISVANGTEIDENKIRVNMYRTDQAAFFSNYRWMEGGKDFNSVTQAGVYGLTSDSSYQHNPLKETEAGFLFVYPAGTAVMQIVYDFEPSGMYSRKYFGGTWSTWYKTSITTDFIPNGILATGSDLNDCDRNGAWLLPEGNNYSNFPSGILSLPSFLFIFDAGTAFIQALVPWTADTILMRRKHKFQSAWSSWNQISGGGGGGATNNYYFNEYQNTVTNNVSPSITTDTNNYMAATGDTTDVTAAIEALLATGECRLGPGNFYVSGIDMPENSILHGCGEATVIKLLGSFDGYAVKMGNYCTISDLKIDGQSANSSTVGGRHGILWQGNYTETENQYAQPRCGRVHGVHIIACSGGGITCYDTGYGTFNNLNVTNCLIETCSAGINIAYWSEFHKFSNVQCRMNYYGCINNGGNNTFANCDFSENRLIAFLMDNESDQSPNNAHGSAIGCVFNHTNSNTGIGIKVLNTHNGFVFDGCQIFYSQIYLEDSKGIEIVNTNFGQINCDITVKNGGVILFANNLHQGAPTISISNNQNVHFVNCYNRTDGSSIGA